MDILEYKNYEGTAELDMNRNICRGKILFINDLVTYEASSPEKLQGEFEAAVDDYIETCKMVGKEPQKPLKGQFNVRISPELHRAAALLATAAEGSLNDVVVQALTAFLKSTAVTFTTNFDKIVADNFEQVMSTKVTISDLELPLLSKKHLIESSASEIRTLRKTLVRDEYNSETFNLAA